MLIFGILLGVTGLVIIVFFKMPGSKTRTEFNMMINNLTIRTDHAEDLFKEEDITGLPAPVQKYFWYCGYIGKPKIPYMKIVYKDVDFSFGKGKTPIKIDYTQYNFVDRPERIAYIDSSIYGLPFEGLDSYVGGKGSMKGVIAKLFTLFDQTGKTLDSSSLVTFLSECLFIPNAALQEYIVWQAVDAVHSRAYINYYGISVSGLFTFNEKGEMLSFTTDDREVVSVDGKRERIKWTVVCNEYEEMAGIKKPTVFKAIWNYDDGDLVYFNGRGTIT